MSDAIQSLHQDERKSVTLRLRVLEDRIEPGVFPKAGIYELAFWPEGVLTMTHPDGSFEQWLKP